ncbi:MAG: FecR family protein [Myxococcota bacterium]
MTLRHATLVAFAALWPALGFAAVGKVVALEGTATRTPSGGKPAPLVVGADIELKDTLEVSKTGKLKLALNDESVIILGEGAKLEIREAEFAGLERKGFWGHLGAGKLWTKVKRALGGGKFEVSTEKAVAGVRGTIFRIDAQTMVNAASGRKVAATIVRVSEGQVAVRPSSKVARSSGKKKPAATPKGPRREVPPPFQEISKDQWETLVAELQHNRQIAVGVDLWELSEYEQAAKEDAFSKWVDSNQ